MPRQKIGNKQTLGISLNDGIEEDAAILAAIRASGKSPSQAIRAALMLWKSAAADNETEETRAAATPAVDLEWLKSALNALVGEVRASRRDIAELKRGGFIAPDAHIGEGLSDEQLTGLSEKAIKAFRDRAHPGLRLDDKGEIVQ